MTVAAAAGGAGLLSLAFATNWTIASDRGRTLGELVVIGGSIAGAVAAVGRRRTGWPLLWLIASLPRLVLYERMTGFGSGAPPRVFLLLSTGSLLLALLAELGGLVALIVVRTGRPRAQRRGPSHLLVTVALVLATFVPVLQVADVLVATPRQVEQRRSQAVAGGGVREAWFTDEGGTGGVDCLIVERRTFGPVAHYRPAAGGDPITACGPLA